MEQAEIVGATIRHECANEPDLEARLRKAMKAARNHWMVTEENEQFKGALAAALMETANEAEKDRLIRSARALNRVGALIQALQAGVPVDLESMAAEPKDDDLLPLRKIWNEVA